MERATRKSWNSVAASRYVSSVRTSSRGAPSARRDGSKLSHLDHHGLGAALGRTETRADRVIRRDNAKRRYLP